MNSAKVEIEKKELLSDNWYVLNKYTIRLQQKDGSWQTQAREVYDRGNGATILLYNENKKNIILTRQFRLPTFLNGNADGMLIEACAGLLDQDSPDEAVKRETEEETGYTIKNPEKVFELYMSPGSVTEILHFYIGEYSEKEKTAAGGGVAGEGEDIEVLELPFEKALEMVSSGEIKDAKTVLLLQHLKIKGILQA